MESDQVFEDYNMYNYGDVIRLETDWYEKNGFPFKRGSCYKVKYQYFDWVITDRGSFSIEDVKKV
ncbi:MAG TPA: hypothetical protein GX498_03450 [Clostridiales bacterium]|nr:hypothetical protein [Clostridiales bacterium]